jgi:hypothetical protein
MPSSRACPTSAFADRPNASAERVEIGARPRQRSNVFNSVRRERTTSDGDGDHLLLIAFDGLKASPAAKWESCRAAH